MKNIKIGIFGAGRGMDLVPDFMLNGCDIVAVCDFNEYRLKNAVKKLGKTVAEYKDFEEFIKQDMDAVVLANYFHEHTPFAIKCFERGLHVYSECISNGTMAEGVELLRAFEKSNCVYMLGENYPQMKFTREIKRVSDSGSLGKILYAEGEYNHPVDHFDAQFMKRFNYFPEHWRNFLPRSYYITHSLGPVMWATGATPVKVTSFAVSAPEDNNVPSASFVSDRVSIVTTQNDDGSVFRITGCAGFGGHHNSYRVCGTKGQIENLRGMGSKVMLRYNSWTKPEGVEEISCYEPSWNDNDETFIEKSGHEGGDYLTVRMFVDCVKNNKQPEHPFDIYSAVTMSSVGILAHRSMLNGGEVFEVPDLRKEECRAKYENDRLSPFYCNEGKAADIPCCSVPEYKPSEKQLELFKKIIKQ